ncbi:MAG TPA: XRE family transcriptional regulator [Streptosporangiaceae bacterium]
MTAPHLSEYETWPGHGQKPSGRRPTPYLLAVLAAVYDCGVTDLIDLADREQLPPADLLVLDRYTQPTAPAVHVNHRPVATPARDCQVENRRDAPLPGGAPDADRDRGTQHGPLDGLPGASPISTMLSEVASGSLPAETEALASILTGNAAGLVPSEQGWRPDIGTLTAEAGEARLAYQACRYAELAMLLPGLLARLDVACAELLGDARSQACALSADVHHVAAGLLLKLDDQGLASLAADRSMRAAQASEDPVTIGASARIITHTLMSGRHLAAAVSAASSHAARMDRDIEPHTPESLSVYGALLLRGSIAASQNGNRGTAHELLGEAEEAAGRLGANADGNLRWTAFGPANAMVYRVNIAVTLGDAGTAIDVARRVDLSKLAVTERKATLLLDVSRAFLQWGRHEQAYTALRAAEATAPEEVAGRPCVHQLVRDLHTTAPAGIRRDVGQFAMQIGVTP